MYSFKYCTRNRSALLVEMQRKQTLASFTTNLVFTSSMELSIDEKLANVKYL